MFLLAVGTGLIVVALPLLAIAAAQLNRARRVELEARTQVRELLRHIERGDVRQEEERANIADRYMHIFNVPWQEPPARKEARDAALELLKDTDPLAGADGEHVVRFPESTFLTDEQLGVSVEREEDAGGI